MELKIIPLGEIQKEILKNISEEISFSLKMSCEILDPIGLPKEFYNPFRNQYLASKILDFISERFKGRILAITKEDLYSKELNFVFGQAELPGRVAVISIARLNPTFYRQPKNDALLIERAVKEAIHEVGHTIGITHCDNPKCVMSFSTNIIEVDRKTKELCKACKFKARIFE